MLSLRPNKNDDEVVARSASTAGASLLHPLHKVGSDNLGLWNWWTHMYGFDAKP